jgi:hypothetical protein
MTISGAKNACVPRVTTIGLSYVLSHLFKVDVLYYMSRGTTREENGMEKAIKSCCLT